MTTEERSERRRLVVDTEAAFEDWNVAQAAVYSPPPQSMPEFIASALHARGWTRSRPVTVSDEAVVAAAKAMVHLRWPTDEPILPGDVEVARAGLTAALPHLVDGREGTS